MKKILTIALSAAALSASAQSEITGVITSALSAEGQPGARISVVGGQQSAMTDETGHFTLSVPSLDVVLLVTAPGCEAQTVYLQGRSQLELRLLSARSSQLSTFNSPPLPRQGAALVTQQSGQPGAATTILVGGPKSMLLSSQPLYIVDGVVWDMMEDGTSMIDGFAANPLNLIDPDDVESVEVIHGAEAAVWGAKAAAGVVRITTKRAHDMVTHIEANIGMGIQQKFRAMPMMNAADYKRYATDVMSGMDKDAVSRFLFTNDDPTRLSFFDTHNTTDWLSLVQKNALVQNYGINVAGGDERALYRFSLGYAQNDGNLRESSFNRLNVRFNSDIHLTRHFTLGTDIYYAQTNTRTPVNGIDEAYSPLYLALAKSPLYGPYQHNAAGEITNRTSDVDELGVSNPVVLLGDVMPRSAGQRFTASLQPRYKFTDRLSFNALLAFHWNKESQDFFMPDGGLTDQSLFNANGEVYAIGLNEVRNLMQRQSTLSANAHLDYDILRSPDHNLSASIGGRYYNTLCKYTAGRGYNTGSDFMKALSNTNSSLRWVEGDNYIMRDGAWFLGASYNYRQRFGLAASAALQASSRYGTEAGGLSIAGTSWMPTAAVDAYWNLSAERFMAALHGVDAKVRFGWSLTGNDRLPINASRTYLTSSSVSQNAVGNVIGAIGNSQLKWETTNQLNVGLDLGFFKGRWTMTFDFYRSTTSDLLSRRSLNAESGLRYYWANGGKLRNTGFELSTTARVIDRRDWRLSLSAALGHYKGEVTELPEGQFTTDIAGAQILTAEGQPVGTFYGYRTEGVFSNTAEAQQASLAIVAPNGDQVPFKAGDVHFTDQNGDHIINDLDRIIIGNPTPDVYGSFDFNLQWKHFSIAPLFTFSVGGDVYNALRADLESGSSLHNQTTAMLSRWTYDGQQTAMPRATYGDPMGNARFSDRWIEDGSYLRLKSLTVSYDIPFHAAMLQNIRVYASACNVFTLSRYLGADPETSLSPAILAQGIDAGLTPQSRSYLFGVKINL